MIQGKRETENRRKLKKAKYPERYKIIAAAAGAVFIIVVLILFFQNVEKCLKAGSDGGSLFG